MASIALTAPTTAIALGPAGGTITGVVLPTQETNSLATYTGFSVPNNGAVLIRVTIGAAGAGNLAFICQQKLFGALLATTTFQTAVANSTSYILGPFSPSSFNDANGLLQATLSVVTGNYVGVYQLPGSMKNE